MKTKQSLYTAILALSAALLSPAETFALDVKVLSVNTGTESGNMKAEIIDGGNRTVTNVIGRRYEMATGNCTERNVWRIFGEENRFISSEVDGLPAAGNDYFFQLEVTFSDGSVVKTDCFNASMTEGAVWLTDIDRRDMTYPETGTYEVGYDVCPNANPGTPIQIQPDKTFGKGISLKATKNPGSALITINTANRNQYGVPFTYTRFTFGYQAFKADGSASNAFGRIECKINNANVGSQANMKAYSRADIGSAKYFYDQIQTNTKGINSMGLATYNATSGTYANPTGWGDNYANLAACRLYYQMPAHTKRAQTVTFDNPGGMIYEDPGEVELSAYTTGHTPISYSIIQGKNLAKIEERTNAGTQEKEWFLIPNEGMKGVIVVEAITMGDDAFDVASATQSYSFNFASSVEYLYTHKAAFNSADQTVFFYVQPKDRTLEKFKVELYDNVRSFNNILSLDLVADGLDKYKTGIDNVYAVPVTVPDGGTLVHRISYKFSGVGEITEGLYEDLQPFVYMTDLADTEMNISMEHGEAAIDMGFEGDSLANSKYKYAKGYGVHAEGYIETPADFDLSPYSRFCVDMGGQGLSDASASRGRVGYALYNGTSQAYFNTGATAWDNVFEWDFPIHSSGNGKTIKLEFDAGGDGNVNDVICIGAPRFYYVTSEDMRHNQTIDWYKEEVVNHFRTRKVNLAAKTSSGLPVYYHIARGQEFGYLEDNSTLVLNLDNIAASDVEAQILVEAIQPGNNDYRPAPVASCLFCMRKSLLIRKDERVELDNGNDIDELIVYADGKSSGQAVVRSGIINVKRLVLRYTFAPGKWHHIAFPSDLNLANVSDLMAKGFDYGYDSDEGQGGKYFLLREYNTQKRAENGDNDNPWSALAKPEVKAHKGYIMKLESDDDEPVEITFEMHNISLDFESVVRGMYLSVDMTSCEPETRHTVYIRPKNVKGNTLRVDLRYVPTDYSQLPLNHAYALSEMRVTRTPVRGKIRLTLPEQSPCRVGIYDKKGKKLLKAVNYVAPMQIDISDLKPGKYLLTVAYGPAYREMLVDL